MAAGGQAGGALKVNARASQGLWAGPPHVHKGPPGVQPANVWDAPQGHAHGHAQLAGGQVHPSDHLAHWVLHLQAGVELQKGKAAILLHPQVLHCACIDVAHLLGQAHSSALHGCPGVCAGCQHWALLNDLLVPPLHAAVPAIDGNGIPVRVRQQLHLQVAAAGRQLHEEDGAAWHL